MRFIFKGLNIFRVGTFYVTWSVNVVSKMCYIKEKKKKKKNNDYGEQKIRGDNRCCCLYSRVEVGGSKPIRRIRHRPEIVVGCRDPASVAGCRAGYDFGCYLPWRSSRHSPASFRFSRAVRQQRCTTRRWP